MPANGRLHRSKESGKGSFLPASAGIHDGAIFSSCAVGEGNRRAKMPIRDLDTEQSLAATSKADETAVSAGAGSGKTRVLVGRYLYLLNSERISLSEIAAITFTNKASCKQPASPRAFLWSPTGRKHFSTSHGDVSITDASIPISPPTGKSGARPHALSHTLPRLVVGPRPLFWPPLEGF